MTLDLLALGTQVRTMSGALRDELRAVGPRVAAIRELLLGEVVEWEYWRDHVEEQRRNAAWLTAQPLEHFDRVYDLPAPPSAYAVAATDGSQIDIDPHGIAACFVVNIGAAVLQYGPDAHYLPWSRPLLGYQDDDLYIRDPQSGREWLKEGPVLAAYRDIEEGLALAGIAPTLADDRPRLALQDGTLVRWTLSSFDEPLRNHFLQSYLSYLDTMQALGCPVASYLSRPRSREVLGLARLMLVKGNFGRWRELFPERSADPTRGLTDLLLFEGLAEGQRSARWGSMSTINVDFYGPHRIQFFYLRVGRELARVEFPAWVAEEGSLDLVHALVYDQCRKGLGYPNVLARAHEQAVIHGDERRQLGALIERLFAQSDLPALRSAKSSSKLRPGA